MAAFFVQDIASYGGQYLPDHGQILPSLRLLFSGSDSDGIIIDVGANVGTFSGEIIGPWGSLEDQRAAEEVFGQNPNKQSLIVYALEPSKVAYDLMVKRSQVNRWSLAANFTPMMVAAGERDGNATLYGCEPERPPCQEGDPDCKPRQHIENHCSLSPDATMVRHYRQPDAEIRELSIEMLTLDTLWFDRIYNDKGIFLLKIDCEGHDHEVIRGAQRLIRERVPRFVMVEYSHRWQMDGMNGRLEDVVEQLEEAGYGCWAILFGSLAPLTKREPWNPVLEEAVKREQDVNIICGSPYWMAPVVRAHSRHDAPLKFAEYALSQVTAEEPLARSLAPQLEAMLANPHTPGDHLYQVATWFRFGGAPDPALAQDLPQAVRWFRAAKDRGQTEAAFMLGVMTQYGQGTSRDAPTARDLYVEAVQRGHGFAPFMLESLM